MTIPENSILGMLVTLARDHIRQKLGLNDLKQMLTPTNVAVVKEEPALYHVHNGTTYVFQHILTLKIGLKVLVCPYEECRYYELTE